MRKNIYGKRSEIIASDYLKKKGYKILETNYKNDVGEIDIIAKDGETIVFTEVKTRMDDAFGAPSEAVNQKKREKYYKVSFRLRKLTFHFAAGKLSFGEADYHSALGRIIILRSRLSFSQSEIKD